MVELMSKFHSFDVVLIFFVKGSLDINFLFFKETQPRQRRKKMTTAKKKTTVKSIPMTKKSILRRTTMMKLRIS